MSVKMIANVLEYSPRKGNDLLCEVILANVANDEGVCWPSTQYIAQRLRNSERASQFTLASLEKEGDIYRAQARGRGFTNRIVLLIALQPQEARNVLKKWFGMQPGQIETILKKVKYSSPFLKGEKQHQDDDPFTRAMRESTQRVKVYAEKVKKRVKKTRKPSPNTSLHVSTHHDTTDTSVHNNNNSARKRVRTNPHTHVKRKSVAVVASENKNPGLVEHFAERMNAHLGIDLNVARQLAQLPHVDKAYLADWEAFSERNIQEHLDSPLDDDDRHTKDCLGPGYYVLRIKNADQSPYLKRFLERKKREEAHRDDPHWNKGANHD